MGEKHLDIRSLYT